MKVAENVLALVGNTPMVRLSRIAKGLRPTVLGKLEHLNPGGSVKDRIGLLMIEDAEKRGLLRPGGTIVEPTSGNTGVGLAMAAAIKGYRLVCTMPDKMSQEKRDLLRAYGAEVVVCPTALPPESPESYYRVADRLAREIPGGFQPNQYYNVNNPEAHYRTTGPEIWDQTDGAVTHVVMGVGTGGTVSGAGKYLKEKNAEIQIVGADPEGSIYTGDIHPYKTEGIGEDFYPGTFDPAIVDRWFRVSDRDGLLTARRLTREEGILVGGSAGTAMFAALEIARELDDKQVVVVLFPDSGRSYLSKIYNDEWMRQNGFFERPLPATVRDVMKGREAGVPELVVVSKGETVRVAIETMQRYGISQIPVTSDGSAARVGDIVGSVQEKTMLDRVFREPALVDAKVENVMEAPFPVVQATDDVERLYSELAGGAPALVAAQEERPVSIITKADLLEFVAHQRQRR
ncbi:MAG: cystathionine beta-synthase [Chloroflexota bacterium]|nr:cystathionine beta-synthase [Chloroflexota bacterium]MDE3194303.1 cystathionine beta-synthase [Chloroflexota bacterium]